MKRKRPIWHLVVAVLTLICMVLICWRCSLETKKADAIMESCTSVTVGEITFYSRRGNRDVNPYVLIYAKYSAQGQTRTAEGLLFMSDYSIGNKVTVHYDPTDHSVAYAGDSPDTHRIGEARIWGLIGGCGLIVMMMRIEYRQQRT